MYRCVISIDLASISTIFRLDFGTILPLWYYFDFHFYLWSITFIKQHCRSDIYSDVMDTRKKLQVSSVVVEE